MVLDKTGTLTRGEFGVVGIATAPGLDELEALRLAAGVEQDSEHTIAQGIVRSARERGIVASPAVGFQAIPGVGVSSRVDGRALLMGGPALLRGRSVEIPATLQAAADQATRIRGGHPGAARSGDQGRHADWRWQAGGSRRGG
jgi:P-type Cu2+ transporter